MEHGSAQYNFPVRKTVEVLLILPVLLVLVYIVVAIRTGALPNLFAAGTPAPVDLQTADNTQSIPPSVIPIGPATISATATLAFAPLPTLTFTQTPSQTPTFTPSPTPTDTATSTPTGTPTSPEIEGGIAIGNGIIRAIESYALDHGQYPAELADLMPAYLPALPVTLTGQPYFYRSFDATSPLAAEGYWLGFRVLQWEHLTCTYLRRLAYWDCNYASP